MKSLKIKFDQKCFMMRGPIYSLDDVVAQIKARFPNSCPNGLAFSYENTIINGLDDVTKIAKKVETNRIKIEAVAKTSESMGFGKRDGDVGAKLDELSDELKQQRLNNSPQKEKNEIAVRNIDKKKKIFREKFQKLKKQELKKRIQEKLKQSQSQFPKQIYKCFYCQGSESKCKVCNGIGKFTSQSPFIQAIDKIIFHRSSFLRKKQNQDKHQHSEKLLSNDTKEEQKKEEVNIFQSSFSLKQCKIKIPKITVTSSKFNKKKCNMGSEFKWTFCFEVEESHEKLFECYIFNHQSQKVIPVNLKKGSITTSVGPFQASIQGLSRKTFRLFYFDESSEMVFFGEPFEFTIEIIDWEKKKARINDFREYVKKVKTENKIKICIDWSLTQLRQVGINEENYEQNAFFIEELLKQFS